MKHYYQPTNHSCVQTAAAIFLSTTNNPKTPQEILNEVQVRSWPGSDEPAGTPNQDIAKYLVELGFKVEIISFDTWVTDLSWIGNTTEENLQRLESVSGSLASPLIGRKGTELYTEAYVDFIKSGGTLSVKQCPTIKLLKETAQKGPFMATVTYDTLHGEGKRRKMKDAVGEDAYSYDDAAGTVTNHNVVVEKISGDKATVYDPWKKPGIFEVEIDVLISAISTAQIECDNMLIVAR